MTWLTLFNRIGPYLAVVALIAAIAAGGWVGRGWYEDSRDLAEERGAQAAIDAAMERESKIAEKVETRLADLQANERIIDRGVIREIQNPVYRNVCLPAGGLRLLNAAARGEPVPAESSDPVPGDPADPE
ncbi:MAG: hypothetical protein FH747_03115 [Stenotrophomonas sp.]|uniref:hypothetical protein n=1 Tax=Stenotrophomonas sp. TaxID=69392 RepID=UPI001355DE82|nr:hypothetical protein [Stenotrophomonas sp.]MTI72578.1 hypothetical protein [Stenotrophomonas sp.]MTI72638.1 hypothetical protein [Stenotrophomonas sp.]